MLGVQVLRATLQPFCMFENFRNKVLRGEELERVTCALFRARGPEHGSACAARAAGFPTGMSTGMSEGRSAPPTVGAPRAVQRPGGRGPCVRHLRPPPPRASWLAAPHPAPAGHVLGCRCPFQARLPTGHIWPSHGSA